jgi:hypothetical protein
MISFGAGGFGSRPTVAPRTRKQPAATVRSFAGRRIELEKRAAMSGACSELARSKNAGAGIVSFPPEICVLADALEGILGNANETGDTAGSYNLPIRLI